MHSSHAARGVTLIEMMVAIAVMALLLGLAVPSFREASLSSQLRASSTELLASANLARSESVKRRALVTLCPSSESDGDECGAGAWHEGWIVIAPGTEPGTTLVIQRVDPAPSGFRISEANDSTTVTFQPTGVGATAARFTICRATPTPGAQERVVTIDAAGRSTARRTTTGSCS